MTDFRAPQPFNVAIGEPELADETGGREMPLPPVLFAPPAASLIEPDDELYPPTLFGIQGPRMRGQ